MNPEEPKPFMALSDFQREMMWRLKRDQYQEARKRFAARMAFENEARALPTERLLTYQVGSDWKVQILKREFDRRKASWPTRYDLIRRDWLEI